MNRTALNIVVAVLFVALRAGAVPQSGSVSSDFFPVDELREGMRGTGRTVFHGTAIEDFDVEILGVLKNSSPGHDLILARLSGGPLAETGVLQGMSGSPVYVDGRLVGAVAFAFEGSSEPIAGIQPIGQMVAVLDSPDDGDDGNDGPSPAAAARGVMQAPLAILPSEGPTAYLYRVMTALRSGAPMSDHLFPENWTGVGAAESSGGMRPIRTPVFVSGLSQPTLNRFSGVMAGFGLTAVQGGGAGTAGGLQALSEVRIEPGASINAEMVRGDITVSANGTVTHVDGDKVYAFGHPFQSVGPSAVPMSPGYVIALVPTRSTSFKIAAPLDVVGTFEQDRSTGIMGRLGREPRMIPVRVQVQTARGNAEEYNFEVIDDRFMTPLMMNLSLFEIIGATERSLGALTLEVTGAVLLRNGETVALNSAFSGDINAPAEATLATVAPITYLLSGSYEPLRIDQVDITIRSDDQRRNARLDSVRVDRTEARAGETIEVEATLRATSGEEFRETFRVPLPGGLAPGRVDLVIGDGIAVTGVDLRRAPSTPPRNMEQVLRELRTIRRSDRLYVKVLTSTPGAVIGGAELPSLPPSVLAVLRSSRTADTFTAGTETSPVQELELTPSGYIVSGQQSLTVTIIP